MNESSFVSLVDLPPGSLGKVNEISMVLGGKEWPVAAVGPFGENSGVLRITNPSRRTLNRDHIRRALNELGLTLTDIKRSGPTSYDITVEPASTSEQEDWTPES